MDGVCKELDEVKAEMEKLKVEYQAKTELSEKLRKSYNEKIIEIEEAKLKIEKHDQDLSAKAEEISLAKQMYEDLKSNLHQKESVLRDLNSANDKIRADCSEKLRNLEEENRELVLALDEANVKIRYQEQKIRVYKEEIECLKGLLSVSEKKCFEAEQKAQASKELRQRDDMLMKLEEEMRKVEDQLKWKKEQFKHLEEAHGKLQDQFRASKEELELEKSTLLDKISSLQTSLDSQTRISEGLQSRLQMCNQALAHEESRRKILEVQVSESKTCFENVFAEYQEEKSKIEILTVQRDEEIAALRNSLCTKETISKEMEFRIGHLEQENHELRQSLKELQEAQIHNAGAASLPTKLRNKLRSLELAHRDCSTNLKAREAEWSSQMEKMNGDLNECRSELKCKNEQIHEHQMELENCHSSVIQLKLQNEEISVMLMVLKSGFSESHSKLSNAQAEIKLCNKEREERVALLIKQLEMKNSALVKAHSDIEQEREKATSSTRRVESLEAEWSSQMENMNVDLNDCRCELKCKNEQIHELQMDLESCHSSVIQLKLQNEEISVMLMVLKSGFSESHSKLSNAQAEIELRNKEREERVALLIKQLEMKNSSLVIAHADIEQECEKATSLMRRVESLEAEWSSQMENMNVDLNDCRSELKSKDEQIHELQMELERCHSSVMQLNLQNEEISVMLMVLKLGFLESHSKLSNAQSEIELCNKEREERATLLMKQLEMKDSALVNAHADIEQEREKATSLTRRVESLEAEWSSQMENMNGDLNECRSELKCKDEQIHELQMELESCHSSAMQLKLQNEEISVMLMVLKSGFSESHSKLSNAQAKIELCNKEREEKATLLMKQLEMKNSALVKAHADIEQEREKATSLTRRVESLEAEWSSQMENMNGDLNDCRCELKCKDEQIHELRMELESCHSSVMQLKLQNEEMSVMLMVLKLGFSESRSKLSNAQAEIELCNKEREERVALLIKQLEMKNSALVKAHADIEQERKKGTSLTRRVESLDFIEQQHFLVQKELEMYKKMLEESSGSQNHLKEQAYQMENVLKEDLRKVSDALDKANTELSEKTHEVSEIEIELQRWKCVVERLKVSLEENQETRKEMEASLLAQVVMEQTLKQEKESLLQIVEEKGRKIDHLQQQIVSLGQELTIRETKTSTAREETAKAIEEKESFLRIAEEKDKTIDSLRKEIDWLEQESMRRELEGAILVQIESERAFEHEKERLLWVVDEKDQSIKDLQQQTLSLEQDFARSVKTSVLSGLAEKQAEIDMLCEALEKTTTAEVLAEVGIQEKNLVILELKEEISNLQQKLDSQEKSLYSSKQQTEQIEAMLEAKQLEIEKMMDIFGNNMRTSEGLIKELESEKRILQKNVMELSLEREDLLGHIGGVCDRIGEFSGEDMELMGILGSIVQNFDGKGELGVDSKGNDELYDSSEENVNTPLSPTSKKVEASLDNRSPLKELNN